MNERDEPSAWRITPGAALFASIILGILAAVIDGFMAPDIVGAALYGGPVALAAWTRRPRFLWGLAIVLVALTFVYLAPPDPVMPGTTGIVLANRVFVAVMTLLIAGLAHVWIASRASIERSAAYLESQNRELDSLNEDLAKREEEVVRQNEELQSQTEELERQSEELRVSNEELATWEKMLEQLLELSRALTVELKRGELMNKLCEALGLLMEGGASAVIEKRGDEAVVACTYGFGPDGLDRNSIPYKQSFASLVISVGQTAYLEDLRLRPDVVVFQPRTGDPHRSILATPLKLHGKSIGTVEVYSKQAQTWTETQIAMIESVAAQASISLRNAELVESIDQERRRFAAVFRTVPFGMAVAEGGEGSVIRLNPAGAAMLNLSLEENLSASSPAAARLKGSLSQHDSPVPYEDWPILRALRGEEIHGEEYEQSLPGGRRLALFMSAAPIHDAEGRVVGAVAAFADISTQRNLSRELDMRRREAEEASLRKTRFLAAVSHDIRTPANAISLMAELIRRMSASPELSSQIPEMARKLQANTVSMMELVEDLLDIARFDSGKMEVIESEFRLDDLLADEVHQILPIAQEKGISLELAPARPIWLRTDRVKLARVIGNLIGNGIKFSEKGTVRIEAGVWPQKTQSVFIRISDTGIGIAKEHLTHIFDEFSQLRNPERDRAKGTGLGLAICKRLLDVMGGEIHVESSLGRGSVFTVTFPSSNLVLRTDARMPVASDPGLLMKETRSLQGRRILLVEDHTTSREGTRRILVDEGAEVLEAPHGKSALERLDDGIDVVLLDMMLPDMDGREVLKAIQSSRPAGLKGVLVLTGDLTQERIDEIKRLGADGLLGKPIDISKLLAAILSLGDPL